MVRTCWICGAEVTDPKLTVCGSCWLDSKTPNIISQEVPNTAVSEIDPAEEQQIDDFLEQMIADYRPKASLDPYENECAICTFTEASHKDPKMKEIGCCDSFTQVKTTTTKIYKGL